MKLNSTPTLAKNLQAKNKEVTPNTFLGVSFLGLFLGRLQYFSAALLMLLLTASPVLAEAPTVERSSPVRQNLTTQNNVRRLLLLNECRGCNLIGVTLLEAQLMGADLREASLQFADLSGSHLVEANLKGANLTGINLSNAVLINTNLANTRLDWANFSGAQLYTVNVTGASTNNLNLTNAQLRNTPISVGGYEQPLGMPLEPTIPFEDTLPPGVEYEY